MENQASSTGSMSVDLEKALALKKHLGDDFFVLGDKAYEGTQEDAEEAHKEWEEENEGDLSFEDFCEQELTEVEEYEEEDYMVLTDSEADDRWEESLDSYLEECIYPELTGNLKDYFDEDKWKQDARYDGRGHSLSSYDGNENEEDVNGTTYYIYRIN